MRVLLFILVVSVSLTAVSAADGSNMNDLRIRPVLTREQAQEMIDSVRADIRERVLPSILWGGSREKRCVKLMLAVTLVVLGVVLFMYIPEKEEIPQEVKEECAQAARGLNRWWCPKWANLRENADHYLVLIFSTVLLGSPLGVFLLDVLKGLCSLFDCSVRRSGLSLREVDGDYLNHNHCIVRAEQRGRMLTIHGPLGVAGGGTQVAYFSRKDIIAFMRDAGLSEEEQRLVWQRCCWFEHAYNDLTLAQRTAVWNNLLNLCLKVAGEEQMRLLPASVV